MQQLEGKNIRAMRERLQHSKIRTALRREETVQDLYEIYSRRLSRVVDPERKKQLFRELRDQLGHSRKRLRRIKLEQLQIFQEGSAS